MSRTISTLSVSLACSLAFACASDDADVGTTDEALQASTSVEATAEATYATTLIVADASAYASVSAADAPAQLIAAVQARLEAGLTLPACATIATDDRTYVEVTFADCAGPRGLHGVSGTIRAEVAIEPTACGPLSCVGALLYELSTTGLTLNGTTFSGTWSWRDPVAAGVASTWSGELSIAGPRRTIESSSSASVLVTDGCVSYDLDAEVTTSLRSLSVTATGVERCLDACPTAGVVDVIGARGALHWEYGGDDTAAVTTAGGATVEVTLACAE